MELFLYSKKYKEYKIYRKSWWKFWLIDKLEFTLSSRYEDAYQEVERKNINGSSLSYELMDWVKDDIRQQLKTRVLVHNKLVNKAKKLSVRFRTSQDGQHFVDTLDFYNRGGDIYFDSDDAIKREKLLSKLGI